MVESRGTLAHPWVVAVVSLVVLVAGWIIAKQESIPAWEISSVRWINDAPNWVADAL